MNSESRLSIYPIVSAHVCISSTGTSLVSLQSLFASDAKYVNSMKYKVTCKHMDINIGIYVYYF